MSHTSGPWTAAFREMGGYDCMTDAWHISATVGGGWPAPIATVDLTHYGQSPRKTTLPAMCTERAEADARLIAAAPDLLAACKRALEEAGDLRGATRRGDIRAAIAKAEARS